MFVKWFPARIQLQPYLASIALTSVQLAFRKLDMAQFVRHLPPDIQWIVRNANKCIYESPRSNLIPFVNLCQQCLPSKKQFVNLLVDVQHLRRREAVEPRRGGVAAGARPSRTQQRANSKRPSFFNPAGPIHLAAPGTGALLSWRLGAFALISKYAAPARSWNFF